MAVEPISTSAQRVGLVGAGRVGTSVAALLKERGHDIVSVWSRSSERAEQASIRLGSRTQVSPAAAAADADIILVGVVDQAIEPVARDISTRLRSDAVVVHFAGALGIAALAPVSRADAARAALHPVQSVPDVDVGIERLPGSAWGITCSPEIERWARAFVRDELQGLPVDVAEKDRPLWHAAAVMTSNGIAALVSMGTALLDGIGVADPRAVLGPLAEGTLANVGTLGRGGDAFTGPVVRGDRITVERHLSELKARFPELVEEYTLVASAIVSGAERTSRIDDATAGAMRRLLETA